MIKERKIWAQGDMLGMKGQPTCRRGGDHRVKQSSKGIDRVVAIEGKPCHGYI